MDIILLTGNAECGKSTIAKALKEGYVSADPTKRVAVASYANYVKSSAKMLFDWDGQKDEKGRTLLQKWGTDIVRRQNPNFWTDSLIQLAYMARGELDTLIIDDVRFPNEIDLWKAKAKEDSSLKIYTVKIIRVNQDGSLYENHLTPEQRKHPSECALGDYPMDIYSINREITNAETRRMWLDTTIYSLIQRISK